jgi:hypothetical protein
MKKEKLIQAIKENKEISKRINQSLYYTEEQFYEDALRYIKAIREGRVICSIGSVAASGMSRTIKFLECSYNKTSRSYRYYNFFAFFEKLGFTADKNRYRDYFRIGGCGMDMIFHTNYTIMHRLHRLGFINRVQCDKFAQMTPSTI